MEENAGLELPDPSKVAAHSNSPPSELRFDGFAAENSGVSTEDGSPADGGRKAELRAIPGLGSSYARYKTMSPARLPITRSPCLTIPPGLSPATLLDSPVLLSNMKAEPSPTTGTFCMPQIRHDAPTSDSFSSPRDSSNNDTFEEGSPTDFEFKPHTGSSCSSALSSLGPLVPMASHYQQGKPFSSPPATTGNVSRASHGLTLSATPSDSVDHLVASKSGATTDFASEESQQNLIPGSANHVCQTDQRGQSPLVAAERSSEDGYNWRKYGQKHVKGSEFPRSYYKCTHPNCLVKKQLERSHDGHVTEIIYKGKHDHPKPQPSRRLAAGAILSSQGGEKFDGFSTLLIEDKPANLPEEVPHPIETSATPDLSPVSASDDIVEGIGTQFAKVSSEMGEEDDQDLKRRKTDLGGLDVTTLGKLNREPRVVVQTLSEVDILDDGYRWRKYGQKVVKGNPNPRSYYKCTNAGCPVRKHVERASHDPKAVITTYEGKHNHDVPSGRSSGHDNGGPPAPRDDHLSVGLDGGTNQSEENDVISLDLGVGISSNLENRPNQKLLPQDSSQLQCQIPMGSLGHNKAILATPVSSSYMLWWENRPF